jgi:hypothetical protein
VVIVYSVQPQNKIKAKPIVPEKLLKMRGEEAKKSKK